jgi:hypothetical protein
MRDQLTGDAGGSVPLPVSGHDRSPPIATLLLDVGRTHIVCHADRLSAFALQADERTHRASRLWSHTCDGRVVGVAPLGDQRVAVLLEVEGGARLNIVDHRAVHSIAFAKGRPTALAAVGARLAFAVTDADGAATIRIVAASSGRLVKVLDAPFSVDDIAVDTRLNELLAFGRSSNWICRIPIDDPCLVGVAAGLRVALATGAVSRIVIPSAAPASTAPVTERKPSCCRGYGCACCGGSGGQPPNAGGGHTDSGGSTGGGPVPGGGGSGEQPSGNCPWCVPGGPGIVDGCFVYIVVDGRRIVRIDLCHPGVPPCAIMLDRPIERIVKAGAFLVAEGDSGHYLAQIDPATMTIVQARAFPRGGAVVAAHPASPVLMLFDRRLSAWHSLDLAATPPSHALKMAARGRADPGAIFGGP